MAVLPIILPPGVVLIYGHGYEASTNNIVPSNIIFRFGTVYQIWEGGATYIYGGDEVMWKDGDEQCKLAFENIPYTQIECRLVTKQTFVP